MLILKIHCKGSAFFWIVQEKSEKSAKLWLLNRNLFAEEVGLAGDEDVEDGVDAGKGSVLFLLGEEEAVAWDGVGVA